MSNFTDVALLNDLIGNQEGDLKDPDWDALYSQFLLIKEEFEELGRAVDEHDITELRDAVCDILVTTYGMAHRAGADADMDMAEVNRSNMSKFCRDHSELRATLNQYRGMGLKTNSRKQNTIVAVISATDQYDNTGKFYPKGKLLKSINFRVPHFR